MEEQKFIGEDGKLLPVIKLISISNTSNSITVKIRTSRNEGGKLKYYIKHFLLEERKRGISMNTLVIVLIAAVLLCCAYVFYGRWLANKWGIDPKAETPAKKFEDGKRQYQVL